MLTLVCPVLRLQLLCYCADHDGDVRCLCLHMANSSSPKKSLAQQSSLHTTVHELLIQLFLSIKTATVT